MANLKSRIKAVEATAQEKLETAREKAAVSAEQVEEIAHRVSEAVRQRYEATAADLARSYERLRYDIDDVTKSLDRSVRRHPYETAAVAVGAGFLAGLLVGFFARSRD